MANPHHFQMCTGKLKLIQTQGRCLYSCQIVVRCQSTWVILYNVSSLCSCRCNQYTVYLSIRLQLIWLHRIFQIQPSGYKIKSTTKFTLYCLCTLWQTDHSNHCISMFTHDLSLFIVCLFVYRIHGRIEL